MGVSPSTTFKNSLCLLPITLAVINITRNNTDNVKPRKILLLQVLHLPLPLLRHRPHQQLVMGNACGMVFLLKNSRNCPLKTVT